MSPGSSSPSLPAVLNAVSLCNTQKAHPFVVKASLLPRGFCWFMCTLATFCCQLAALACNSVHQSCATCFHPIHHSMGYQSQKHDTPSPFLVDRCLIEVTNLSTCQQMQTKWCTTSNSVPLSHHASCMCCNFLLVPHLAMCANSCMLSCTRVVQRQNKKL